MSRTAAKDQKEKRTMPPIQKKVHINVDLGEAYGNYKCGPDDELIPLIDHANIACGVSEDSHPPKKTPQPIPKN